MESAGKLAGAARRSKTKVESAIVKGKIIKLSGKGKSAGKKTSIVWKFFKPRPPSKTIPSSTVCDICHVVIKTPGGYTSNMLRHLKRHHLTDLQLTLKSEAEQAAADKKKVGLSRRQLAALTPPPHLERENGIDDQERENGIDDQERQNGIDNQESGMGGTEGFPQGSWIMEMGAEGDTDLGSQEVSAYQTGEVTKMMVMHLASTSQPVRIIHGEYFKKMLWNLNGGYLEEIGVVENGVNVTIFSSVVATLNRLSSWTNQEIRGKLNGMRISLSVELWVKSSSAIYVLLTANFLTDDWKLEKVFIGIRKLPETRITTPSDTLTKNVSQAVNLLMEAYGVNTENVVQLVIHPGQLSLDSKVVIVPGTASWPCLNATIQTSYDFLNELAEENTGVDIFRRALSLAEELLPEFDDEFELRPGQLVEAVGNRTFYSADGELVQSNRRDLWELAKFQEPFNVILESLLKDQPVMLASSILHLIHFVSKFYLRRITANISSKWTTEQKQDVAFKTLRSLQTAYGINISDDDLGKDCMLGVCSFLDPRFKKLPFLMEEQRRNVQETIRGFLRSWKGLGGGNEERYPEAVGTSLILVKEEPEEDDEDFDGINSSCLDQPNESCRPRPSKLAEMLGSAMRVARSRPVNFGNSLEELAAYLNEPAAPLKTNPLQWWSLNEQRFPTLGVLARFFLCVPANCTQAKHKFTPAGKQLFNKLAEIEPEFLEKLEILRRYHVADYDNDNSTGVN